MRPVVVMLPSLYCVLWVLFLLSLELYVVHVEARTPLAVKETLKKAKQDSMVTSKAGEYVPPELDSDKQDVTDKDEEAYEDEDAEDVREKMKAFDADETELSSPTAAPSSFNTMNSIREITDEDVDEVREKMDAFQSKEADEILPAVTISQQQQNKQEQEPQFILSQPGVVVKIQEWTYRTKTFKKNEKVLITLSKFDNRKKEQSFPDIQYKIDLKFVDRICRYEYLNETFKSGSGDYVANLVSDNKIGPDEIFAQIEGTNVS